MLGRKKSFPKPQLVHFAELCSKNEALCLMWRAEVGTSAEGFKVNPGPWPAPAPASPGSLQFPPAAIPGCCQAPSWPPSGHLAPIPGRRRRRPRSICTNSRSTAQRPLCYAFSGIWQVLLPSTSEVRTWSLARPHARITLRVTINNYP